MLDSVANATDGARQGGYVRINTPGPTPFHAALWSGTAASFTDLNPGPSFRSELSGMFGDQQVGHYESDTMNSHAALWRGTAQSMIDLNPFPHSASRLLGTCGLAQVGQCTDPLLIDNAASIWFGTPESWVSLGRFLPSGYSNSVASAVTFHSGQFYVSGYAYNNAALGFEAFLWVGVPAPASLITLLAAGLLAAQRRR